MAGVQISRPHRFRRGHLRQPITELVNGTFVGLPQLGHFYDKKPPQSTFVRRNFECPEGVMA
jgi:hypothetical protein